MSRMVRGLAAGLVLGAAWGVLARGFMRLLATQPSFTWSGTLLIVGVSAVAGALVGLVRAARVAGRSRWWRLAAAPSLVLFLGQGLVLLPGALGYALVLRGGRLLRVVGAALVAVPTVLVVSLDGASFLAVTPGQLAGLGVMTLAAAPLGWALAELGRGWSPGGASSRRLEVPAGPGLDGAVPVTVGG